MHVAGVEGVVVREDLVGQLRVVHVLLDPEVVNGETEVQRRGHSDGRKVGGTMEPGADVIECGEVGRLFRMRDAAAVDDRHPDVVDELVANQVMRVPNGVEHLAGCNRCGRVLADEFKAFLQLGGTGIFHPEEMIGLERLAQPRRFDRT